MVIEIYVSLVILLVVHVQVLVLINALIVEIFPIYYNLDFVLETSHVHLDHFSILTLEFVKNVMNSALNVKIINNVKNAHKVLHFRQFKLEVL